MSSKSWHLDRRTFLRGSSVALGLPLLEGMSWGARGGAAGELPRRMCCIYFPNGVSLPPEGNKDHDDWYWFPKGEGQDYKFTKSLQPLEPLRKDLTILGGLSHPGGRSVTGHATCDIWLTGANASKRDYKNSISVDQMAASVVGRDTRIDSLVLSSDGGVGETGRTTTLSYTPTGQPIPGESRIERTFARMFGDDAASRKEAERMIATRRSMLDLVTEDTAWLNRRLGKADQRRLDLYLASVRDVERRVEKTTHWLGKAKPKVDSNAIDLSVDTGSPEEYIRTIYDLIYLAFRTDVTRVATYQIAAEGGYSFAGNFPTALGLPTIHRLSHDPTFGGQDDGYSNWGTWDQFLAQQLAYFLDRLKSTEEEDGSMLDRTMVLYGCGSSRVHYARNYPLVLAGGNAFGLKHGSYLKYEKEPALAHLFVSMLNNMNIPTESFSGVTGELPDLRG
jgi:hypothetical protein